MTPHKAIAGNATSPDAPAYLGDAPELQVDGLTGQFVLVAPGRATRPHSRAGGRCPFCPGAEDATPPETWRLPCSAGGSGWRLRAFSNAFPLVMPATPFRPQPERAPVGYAGPAVGRHEVIVDSPRHDWSMADAEVGEVADVLLGLRERYRAFAGEGPAAVIPFRNHGEAAGASLAHPHSQILSLSPAPPELRRQWARAWRHWQETGRRLVDDTVDRDVREGRVIFRSDGALAVAPFAGAPLAVRILPDRPTVTLGSAGDDELSAVADVLRTTVRAVEASTPGKAWTLVMYGGPPGSTGDWTRWYVDLQPGFGSGGGLEAGTGLRVSTIPCDDGAGILRAAISS